MAVTLTQLSAFLASSALALSLPRRRSSSSTQPSVSAAVAALERELGVELTERAGRGVRPTAAGEAYARYAADVLGLLREGSEAAGDSPAGPGGGLRITAVTTAGEHLPPPLISASGSITPSSR